MKKTIVRLVFILATFLTYGQKTTLNDSALVSEIKKQAFLMGDDFIKGDYHGFAKYNHPKILKLMGGENQMIATLTKSINDTKNKGVVFTGIKFDNPTKIIKYKNELQCTIQQHLMANVSNGKMISTSTLIAISLNNGKNWYFVDTSNKDMKTLRNVLPTISNEIVIPKQNQPEFIKS